MPSFKLVLPQLLVLLSHKRVANVLKHYINCIVHFTKKEHSFFLRKMYVTTAIDLKGDKLEVILSLN